MSVFNGFIEHKAPPASIKKRKMVYGVGINDAPYRPSYAVDGKSTRCPYFHRWRKMIQRCYDPKWHVEKPTYADCSVAEEWLTFTVFRAWMEQQPWRGNELDKDLIRPGNKVYSSSACAFVPKHVNTLLGGGNGKTTGLPQGVVASGKSYRVKIRRFGKEVCVGSYRTIPEARIVHLKAKVLYMVEVSLMQTDPRLMNGIAQHAQILQNEVNSLESANM